MARKQSDIADEAIGLFLEIRDQHGVEDEDVARAKAVLEFVDGQDVLLPHEKINAELLAALERAKGFVDSWGKKLGDWDVVDQNTINAIDTAIAKARGN